MSRKPRSGRHRVVAVAYDGLCTFEFGCVVELFALERPELGVDWYDFAVCSAERGPLRAAGGIEVRVPNSLALYSSTGCERIRRKLTRSRRWRGGHR